MSNFQDILFGQLSRRVPTHLSNGDGQSVLYGSSVTIQSPCQDRGGSVKFLRPFTQSTSLPKRSNQTIGTGVVSLHDGRGPTTVHQPSVCNTFLAFAARVVAVIVDAVYGMLRTRSHTHVSKERFKSLTPSAANRNAAILVVSRIMAVFLKASGTHSLPSIILRGSRHAVRSGHLGCVFFPVTSTRLGMATYKAILQYIACSAAFTQAVPCAFSAFARSTWPFPNNSQPTKYLSKQVQRRSFHSFLPLLMVAHEGVAI